MPKTQTYPKISVIIPVWNGADRIAGTLDALHRQSADSALFEVIVVDNGSTDDTLKIVGGYPAVRLLSEPEPGSYRARNRGVGVARGEWLLFTDGDCVPARDWIEQALRATRRFPKAAVIGGRIDLFREDGAGNIAYQYEQMMAFNQRANIEAGRCVTANWLSPKHLIVELGGFAQELLSGGDVEMSNRVNAAGYTLAYADEMRVGHPSRANLAALVSKRRRTMGGRYSLQNVRPRELPYWLKTLSLETFTHMRKVRHLPLSLWTKAGLLFCFLLLLTTAQIELVALSMGKAPHRS